MKLCSINSNVIASKTNLKPSINHKANIATNNQTNSIASNSLQEAIGRSMVNFTGNGKRTESGFTFDKTGILGGSSEHFEYDKKTGNMVYIDRASNGDCLKEIRYNYQTGEEYYYELNEFGESTTIETSPNGKKIEKRDEFNRPDTLTVIKPNGDKMTSKYNHDRHRVVVRLIQNNQQRGIKVFDLESKQEVFSGPMVIDDIEGKDGVIRTVNIITGQVYKTNEIIDGVEVIKKYSEQTGELTTKIEKEKNAITTTTYKNNIRQNEAYHNLKSGAVLYTKFSQDGQSIVESFEEVRDDKNRLTNLTIFDPLTGCTITETIYDYINDTETLHEYSEYTNKKQITSVTSMSEDRLLSQTFYDNDGKTPVKTREFDIHNNCLETWYAPGKKGRRAASILTDADDKFLCFTQYNSIGKVYETRKPHDTMPDELEITTYDQYTYRRTTKDIVKSPEFGRTGNFRADGRLLVRYYYDESTGKRRIASEEFNPDGTFVRKEFDKNHKQISETYHNPDGTLY